MPNIYEVARLAGVSTTTAPHILNSTRHLGDDTKARAMLCQGDWSLQSARQNDVMAIGAMAYTPPAQQRRIR